jgi:hypothetical protein
MTALTLRRSDPTRNMHRYYRLDVQLDLFGAWCFIREWGCIGQAGQTHTVLYPTRRRRTRRLSGSGGRRSAGGIYPWPDDAFPRRIRLRLCKVRCKVDGWNGAGGTKNGDSNEQGSRIFHHCTGEI